MGFIKQREIDNKGIYGTYWRIVQLNINYDRPDVIVTVCLYVDKAGREAGKNPTSESYQFDLKNEFLESNPQGKEIMKNVTLQKAYTAIKKLANDEMAKPENERNVNLAFFWDATDD